MPKTSGPTRSSLLLGYNPFQGPGTGTSSQPGGPGIPDPLMFAPSLEDIENKLKSLKKCGTGGTKTGPCSGPPVPPKPRFPSHLRSSSVGTGVEEDLQECGDRGGERGGRGRGGRRRGSRGSGDKSGLPEVDSNFE
ncbi:hypothetical protein HWI79_3420 [Cryptosporidium felis]|nr:hypothetical protein HWI79_3420 [Cryptosporidium felis]